MAFGHPGFGIFLICQVPVVAGIACMAYLSGGWRYGVGVPLVVVGLLLTVMMHAWRCYLRPFAWLERRPPDGRNATEKQSFTER